MKNENLNERKNKALSQADVMQSAIFPNDLRIGNLISFWKNTLEVSKITELKITAKNDSFGIVCENYTEFSGIKITEEMLMKIGYKKMPSGTYLQPNSGNFIWFEEGLKCCIAGEYYPENIKYIHQLQNLHFALTQRELAVA